MTQHTITYDDATHAVVPRKPSEEMIRAIWTDPYLRMNGARTERLIRTAIAAAPQPEAVMQHPLDDGDIRKLAITEGLGCPDSYGALRTCWSQECSIDDEVLGFAHALLSSAGQSKAVSRTVPSKQVIEDTVDAAYWEFDAQRKGLAEWRGCPASERDAYKRTARALLACHGQSVEMPNDDDLTAFLRDHAGDWMVSLTGVQPYLDKLKLVKAALSRYGQPVASAEPIIVAHRVMRTGDYPGTAWIDGAPAPDTTGRELFSDGYVQLAYAAPVAAEAQPVVNQSTEREAFERWFTRNDPTEEMAKRGVERGPNGGYRLMQTHTAWETWQARAALAQQPGAQLQNGQQNIPGIIPAQPSAQDREDVERIIAAAQDAMKNRSENDEGDTVIPCSTAARLIKALIEHDANETARAAKEE